ncbi:MAG: hypothetical protein V3V00_09345, partial [Saprospiraceae bacterium]
YLPSSWSFYVPSWVEIGIFLGTLGLFFTLFLLFTRVAPVVAIAEVKSILKSAGDQYVKVNKEHNDRIQSDFSKAVEQNKSYVTHTATAHDTH